MITIPFRDNPPQRMQIFCVIAGAITMVAIGVGAFYISHGTTNGYLVGGLTVGLGVAHMAILIGLWRMNERAWKSAIGLYTIAILFNVMDQNLVGMILDTAIVVLLLSTQTEYRDLPQFDTDPVES